MEDRVTTPSQPASYYRLTPEEKRLVDDLRARVKDQLTPRYDTDFNLYRWIKLTERTSKKNVLDAAEKLLRNHLRYRKTLNMDAEQIPDWDENPLFTKLILPRGYLNLLPSTNRFLWWTDYSDIDAEGLTHTYSSRDLVTWHIWKYEHMLRLVNEREKETGAMSGICSVMDIKNLSLSPAFMSAIRDGHMSYIAQLIHYEHYPELATPIRIINVSKILMVPYRIVRPFMPHDFTERFCVSDTNFKPDLLEQMTESELPEQLGGKNTKVLSSVPPAKINPSQYYRQRVVNGEIDKPKPEHIFHIHLPVRKRKIFLLECRAGAKLTWHVDSDADILFGIYFMPSTAKQDTASKAIAKGELLDKLDMVVATMLLLTHVPEKGSYTCSADGTLHFLFCNKHSWFCRRHVQAKIEIDGEVKTDLAEL